MARRPFDPKSLGLAKTEYRQGDVLDRDAVGGLAAEADVLVHLAFIILGGREETRSINLEGSRNVFEAARDVKRLVYTSSVAAYGFHADNPQPLTEDVPVRGTDAHYYSAQKAELEATLRDSLEGSDTETYVLRPCIVAGGDALALVEAFPGIVRKSPVTRAARPRHRVPARAHRRRRDRRGRRGPRRRASRAPTTWPATARSRPPTSPARSAGRASRCRASACTPPPPPPACSRSCPLRPRG